MEEEEILSDDEEEEKQGLCAWLCTPVYVAARVLGWRIGGLVGN